MPEWTGKSVGSALGYRIFIFILKNLGLDIAYFLLYFVAAWFVLFSGKAFGYSYSYFRVIHKYNPVRSFFCIYGNFFRFGQTILDKVVLSAGFKAKYTMAFDGRGNLDEVVEKGLGGILISAHMGNFEMAASSLDHLGIEISVVTLDGEREDIKNILEKENAGKGLQFIPVSQDLSHIFRIGKAIADHGIVCLTGDRYKPNDKFLETKLMGYNARFPAGPFEVASRLKVPVAFVFGMKATSKKYQFYARVPQCPPGSPPQVILNEFVKVLEEMLRLYPAQWFNFYDFWDFQKK